MRSSTDSREIQLLGWDGHTLRRQAIDLVAAVTSADVFYMQFLAGDDGVSYGHIDATDDVAAHYRKFEGAPAHGDSIVAKQPPQRGWTVTMPGGRVRNGFTTLAEDYGRTDAAYAYKAFQEGYAPVEVCDQARALMYDGTEFLGFIAALRRGRESFDETTLDRLRQHTATVRNLLLLARRAEEALESDTMHLVFGEGDRVRYADERAAMWLSPRRVELLNRVLRDGRAHSVDGMCPTDGWLDTGSARLRHVVLSRVQPVRVSRWQELSGSQRDIVSLALEGFSNKEIANMCGITASTVKYHLAEASRTLGVEGRVGLRGVLLGP